MLEFGKADADRPLNLRFVKADGGKHGSMLFMCRTCGAAGNENAVLLQDMKKHFAFKSGKEMLTICGAKADLPSFVLIASSPNDAESRLYKYLCNAPISFFA